VASQPPPIGGAEPSGQGCRLKAAERGRDLRASARWALDPYTLKELGERNPQKTAKIVAKKYPYDKNLELTE